MTPFFVLLSIYGFATLFFVYFKKKVSVSIFFSITAIITFLFLFSLTGLLKFGFYTLFYGGIISFVSMFLIDREAFLKFCKSPPFIIFTLVSLFYYSFMKDAHFFFWDEYSHWGTFIKYIYYTDSLYDLNTTAAHLNYPPGASLWDYFVIRAFEYREGNVYFAYFLLIFSSLLMMYENLTFKKDSHWIVLIFTLQVVLLADFGHWLSSIYVDHVIGALCVGVFLAYMVDNYRGKELLLFLFPLVSIVLIKEIGLYFGVAFLGFVLLEKLMQKRDYSLSTLIFLFVVMLGTLEGWSYYQKSKGVQHNGQTLSAVATNIFLGKHLLDKETEAKIKEHLNDVILHQQLHKEKFSLSYNEFSYQLMPQYKKSVKLTTVGVFLFFIIAFLLRVGIEEKQGRKEITLKALYFFAFSAFYIFFILYESYFVAFGKDALRVPSYVRYANIAILPLLVFLFSLFLPLYTKRSSDKKLFFTVLAVLLVLVFITRPYLHPLYSPFENRTRDVIVKLTDKVLLKIPSQARLLVVLPVKDNGSLVNIIRYSLIPAKTTVSPYDFENKSFSEMVQEYSKYQYVWFVQLDKTLVEKNMQLLHAKADRRVYVLYKVVKNGKLLRFEPLL